MMARSQSKLCIVAKKIPTELSSYQNNLIVLENTKKIDPKYQKSLDFKDFAFEDNSNDLDVHIILLFRNEKNFFAIYVFNR
jgi:hypothetical protein